MTLRLTPSDGHLIDRLRARYASYVLAQIEVLGYVYFTFAEMPPRLEDALKPYIVG